MGLIIQAILSNSERLHVVSAIAETDRMTFTMITSLDYIDSYSS